MKNSLLVITLVFLGEILLVLLVLPTSWISELAIQEQEMIRTLLGTGTQTMISGQASHWYRTSLIDSGAYDAINHFFIPSTEERDASRGMQNLGGHAVFPYVTARLEMVKALYFLIMLRLSSITIWLPYLAIMALPAIYDGYNQWQINRSGYGYASPLKHRYAVRGLGALLILSLIGSLLPFPVPPVVIPIAGLLAVAFLGLSIRNLQKRM